MLWWRSVFRGLGAAQAGQHSTCNKGCLPASHQASTPPPYLDGVVGQLRVLSLLQEVQGSIRRAVTSSKAAPCQRECCHAAAKLRIQL